MTNLINLVTYSASRDLSSGFKNHRILGISDPGLCIH